MDAGLLLFLFVFLIARINFLAFRPIFHCGSARKCVQDEGFKLICKVPSKLWMQGQIREKIRTGTW